MTERMTVQVGRWTYHFRAPAGLVLDVVPGDDTMPKSATVVHWPTRECQEDGCHPVGECVLYDYISTPVTVARVA